MLAFACLVFLPFLGLPFRLHYFIPPLVIAVYQRSSPACLLFALLCGLCMDIVCASGRFGVYPFAYMCSVTVLIRCKSYFFSDSLSTLPVLTGIGAAVASIALLLVSTVSGRYTGIGMHLIITDGILMSLLDAGYSYFVFILPAVVLGKRRRGAKEYFNP